MGLRGREREVREGRREGQVRERGREKKGQEGEGDRGERCEGDERRKNGTN